MDAGQFSILGTLLEGDENNIPKFVHPPAAPLFKLKLGSSDSNDKGDPNAPKYYNNHLLHVTTGVAYQGQVAATIRKAITDINKVLDQPLKCDCRVNLVTDRNGTHFGYGYAWVSNTEVYHILLGKNPDGSERIDYTDDPNWQGPTTL